MLYQVAEESVFTRRGACQIGDLVADRYQIVSVLGEGGMGLVYKARHVLMNRFVAIKMIRSELVNNLVLMQRFQQEAQAVSKLQHPNIVTVYDFGVTPDGTPFLVMDYLDGRSFAEVISKEEKIPVGMAMEVFLQACMGLQHAHEKGVIHRDFKSSNLMICDQADGVIVKVVDFGMAKLMRPDSDDASVQELTQTGEIFGSPLYMSPEQCRGQRLDERSDIYSLACVMYYALCGEPPFLGENMLDTLQKQIHDDPSPINRQDSSVPADLEAIIMKALRKNPEQRYQHVSEILIDLQAVAAGRQRIFATLQMEKPVIKPPPLEAESLPLKRGSLLGQNFEINVAVVLALGAAIISLTAYLTTLYVEAGEGQEINMWVDRNQAGDRFTRSGKFDDAQRCYKEAISEAMKFGRTDPRLAKSLVSLGDSYIADKEYELAIKQFQRAIGVLEKSYGQNCAELAPVYVRLARAYTSLGDVAQARVAKQRARSIVGE